MAWNPVTWQDSGPQCCGCGWWRLHSDSAAGSGQWWCWSWWQWFGFGTAAPLLHKRHPDHRSDSLPFGGPVMLHDYRNQSWKLKLESGPRAPNDSIDHRRPCEMSFLCSETSLSVFVSLLLAKGSWGWLLPSPLPCLLLWHELQTQIPLELSLRFSKSLNSDYSILCAPAIISLNVRWSFCLTRLGCLQGPRGRESHKDLISKI